MNFNWKNPKEELPERGKLVAVLIEPHKFKDTLKNSLQSSIIYFGISDYGKDGKCTINNCDELGSGDIRWQFEWNNHSEEQAVAWSYVDDTNLPNFVKDPYKPL